MPTKSPLYCSDLSRARPAKLAALSTAAFAQSVDHGSGSVIWFSKSCACTQEDLRGRVLALPGALGFVRRTKCYFKKFAIPCTERRHGNKTLRFRFDF